MQIRVSRFLQSTRVEGPGLRACIWVQGCPIRCAGCAVPWTWDDEAGDLVETEVLIQRILHGPQVEGVTFVGGEPFAQAASLAVIGRALRSAGLSVVTFTGYVIEDIIASERPDWQSLLKVSDLLIDGPFRQEMSDLSRPWIGSSNQRYHFLTERYRHLQLKLADIPNKLEVRIQTDGTVLINGMASAQQLRQVAECVAGRSH